MPSKTIVFIHGIYMTPLCWEHWLPYFEAKSYRCLAPGWLGRDKTVEELRKNHPDPALGQLTLGRIIEHYAALIQTLDEKPVLIGHSRGGLLGGAAVASKAGCRRWRGYFLRSATGSDHRTVGDYSVQ